jgi:hypothetical protein
MENWRRFINEAPIVPRGFAGYEGEGGPLDPSVGFRQSKKPAAHKQVQKPPGFRPLPKPPFVGKTFNFTQHFNPNFKTDLERMMKDTKDNWVIITLRNVKDAEEQIKTKEFRDWLASKGYPENSKVIVVGTAPFKGDFSRPEWILHDILGHAAGKSFLDQGGYFNGSVYWLSANYLVNQVVIKKIHAFLQQKNADVANAGELFDKFYDVFASIILEHIWLEEALELFDESNYSEEQIEIDGDDHLKLIEKRKKLVKEIFKFCDEWVNDIPSNSGVPVLLKLWI